MIGIFGASGSAAGASAGADRSSSMGPVITLVRGNTSFFLKIWILMSYMCSLRSMQFEFYGTDVLITRLCDRMVGIAGICQMRNPEFLMSWRNPKAGS